MFYAFNSLINCAKKVVRPVCNAPATFLLRLDQNRARAQIAGKCGVGVAKVEKCIIWGNHSSTQFPDAFHATVDGKPVPEVSTFIGNYKIVLFHVYLKSTLSRL